MHTTTTCTSSPFLNLNNFPPNPNPNPSHTFSQIMPPRKRKTRPATSSPETQLPEPNSEPIPEPELPEPEQTLKPEDPEIEQEEEEEPEMAEDNNKPEEQQQIEEDPMEDDEEEIEEEEPQNAAVSVNGDGQTKPEEPEKMEEPEEEELEPEPIEKLLEPFTKDQLTLLIKESVTKHPDLLSIVHKLADTDPAHCKVFVFGLGWEATDETVTSVFDKYGEIVDCKVVKDKNTGKSKGYCFILFKNRLGARKALKQPQKLIDGRMTTCQLASAGPVQNANAPSAPVVNAVVSSGGSVVASEYTQRKIYVSNVSAELDVSKLVEFFGKFGEIEEGPLGLDKQTGKPRGFCLFVYKSVEGARKALEEPHKSFEGQMLHCQKAVDGPKHSKGGGQFGGQLQHGQTGRHQGYHHQHPAKKGRYAGGSGGGGGMGHQGGHLMAPSGGPSVGFNPVVAPAAIGQAVAALLATQNLGGYGGGMHPQGVPPMMGNAGYGGQGGVGGYGGQPGMQGGYGGQPQMGQGGVRPYQGGAPYMGRGH